LTLTGFDEIFFKKICQHRSLGQLKSYIFQGKKKSFPLKCLEKDEKSNTGKEVNTPIKLTLNILMKKFT
jgi:hypothetical protein